MKLSKEKQSCPKCGKPMLYKAVRCVECDYEIPDPASAEETAVCYNCNFDVPLGSTQCSNCGAKLFSKRPVSVWQAVLPATLIPIVGFSIIMATQSRIKKSKMTGYDIFNTYADGWMIFVPLFGIPIVFFIAYLFIRKKYPDVALGIKIGLIIHLLNPLSLCFGWLGCVGLDRANK